VKIFVLFLCTASVMHIAHLQLDRVSHPQNLSPRETFPSAESLKFISLGYKQLAADYYWMRAIEHFGDKAMHRYNYPNIVALIQRVLALDPYFGAAYFFAGTALTIKGIDPRISIGILERGLKYRPDLWHIPFLLGFNEYFFMHNYSKAARALAIAAKFPKAPPEAGGLATRLAAEAGEPEIGLQMIDSIMSAITDPKVSATYEERKRLLTLEVHLKWLNQAADKYRQTMQHQATSLDDLVRVGLLKEIPAEPMGGKYSIDANGVVQTTTTRLRLPPIPQGKTP
jgi:hypothetical protein